MMLDSYICFTGNDTRLTVYWKFVKSFHFCILCISGKGFAGRGGLYLHTKIHTKDYPHQCETCHKRFPTKQRLNDHLKVRWRSPFRNDQRVFLPPANEVWGKVIFLHLFVILFTGGIPPPGTRHHPPGTRHHPPPPGTRHTLPQCRACWEIRSMRRRYASYWNAIL